MVVVQNGFTPLFHVFMKILFAAHSKHPSLCKREKNNRERKKLKIVLKERKGEKLKERRRKQVKDCFKREKE
jgi:hypothetical protein